MYRLTLTHDQSDVSKKAVKIKPANHPAESFDLAHTQRFTKGASPEETAPETILRSACAKQHEQCAELLQSSFGREIDIANIIPQKNGFVHAAIEAYSHHRALVVRPDDVWLSILTQFSVYVNAHAEELRSSFVAHQGKKELVVSAGGDRYSVDFGDMARQMTGLLHKNLVDPELRDWILPIFSTTTITDSTVASIVMMATMKKYFSFKFSLICGIPQVIIDGTKDDWEAILARAEKLKEYGLETAAWYHLLRPVLMRFVQAFEEPSTTGLRGFWGKVAHYHSGGSGPTYLMGWITAFCVFNEDGDWQGPRLQNTEITTDFASLSTQEFASRYFTPHPEGDPFVGDLYLSLDGTFYPHVDSDKVPPGYAEVDVKLDDNGEILDTLLVAGSVGSLISDSGDQSLSKTGERDTVKTLPGWWMFVKNGKVEE
ncbi:hypothetical protein CONPUDRAFT_170209 [Coniophora puteana RWD-64-598 SS2]|uniref:DUF4419 domain-containing protein n=1 Tax=Coniophora puteana (strain RWD-64-598) TaxID=741705 RepID=R7SDE3_CONPW|nr:uncharacterized protein CONPUDRAFT_170209 [Coniophora puteana RWD-64-598 SS2]EIW74183.1 hypothetical protein CONPUDRAFT_170209 [Coniophora puteana RWD-64-598 SS2]